MTASRYLRYTPRATGPDTELVDEWTTQCVRRLTHRVGTEEAQRLLGVNHHTFDELRGFGRVKRVTLERVRERLEQELR